jgi:hypothetical protein
VIDLVPHPRPEPGRVDRLCQRFSCTLIILTKCIGASPLREESFLTVVGSWAVS